jgi:arylsulfatase A-like enzyme
MPRLAARVIGLAALVIGLSALIGCERERIDVVWIVLDALPARQVSLYGGLPEATPHIAALAERAVVVDGARAQASTTLPSTASFLTGLYPDRAVPAVRAPDTPGLASWLRAAGYRTGSFSENPWVVRVHGFGTGFDTFEEIGTPPGRPPGHRDSERTVERALDWLLAERARPAFLYVHLLVPHAPYAPPAPFRGRFTDPRSAPAGPRMERLIAGRERTEVAMRFMQAGIAGEVDLDPRVLDYLRDRYRENVAFADHLVDRVWRAIEAAGRADSTLLVVSSDHGEAFGPHPELFHGGTLYDTQIRVPLLFVAPGSLGLSPGRYRGVVELVDVAPTIADLLDLGIDARLDGRSLAPWLRGEAPAPSLARAYLEDTQAVVDPSWKLVRGPAGDALFRYVDDPDELIDRAAEEPDRVAALTARIDARTRAPEGEDRVTLSPEAVAELQALGYAVGPEDTKPDER